MLVGIVSVGKKDNDKVAKFLFCGFGCHTSQVLSLPSPCPCNLGTCAINDIAQDTSSTKNWEADGVRWNDEGVGEGRGKGQVGSACFLLPTCFKMTTWWATWERRSKGVGGGDSDNEESYNKKSKGAVEVKKTPGLRLTNINVIRIPT